MREMVLIGGPYDGAIGPSKYAGFVRLWVRASTRGGPNGLLVGIAPRDGSITYELADNQMPVLRYVCAGVDLRDPALVEDACA